MYRLLPILVTLVLVTSLNAQIIIHQEDFEDCSSVSWQYVSGPDDQDSFDRWDCEMSEDSLYTYAYINGFSGGLDDDWLISPVLDFGADIFQPQLVFKYRNIFTGPDISLWYSLDFAGDYSSDGVEEASWSQIDLDFYDIFANDLLFNAIFHSAIPLDFLVGETRVTFAFQYQNTLDESERWEIDDILIYSDYYRDIEDAILVGDRCADLKSRLHHLINDHTTIDYSGSVLDVWDAFHTTDRRLSDDGQREIVYDMTTDNPDGADAFEFSFGVDRDMGTGGGTEGDRYNREHSFPKSWWGGGNDPIDTPFFDLHHVIPSDKFLNGLKSFLPIGEVGSASFVSSNGTRFGSHGGPDYSGEVYEPIDDYKGDYARMYFYMAARYEHEIDDWEDNTISSDVALNGDPHTVYEDWLMQTLLHWHQMDPVSEKEIRRNDAIYSFQKNRNPFIDRPELVGLIWGLADGTACDIVSGVVPEAKVSRTIIAPNPATHTVDLLGESQIKTISLIDLSGKTHLIQAQRERLDVSQLPAGIYFLLIDYQDGYRERLRLGKL